ncbi:glycosyltransferase family 4 protein [uncultured Bacteroides sp.]|uniref:glycosyltransferase family 4 protein n=1 Tax=uncultured Bacteroides sp. TaxID=162156 RepID=UPI002AAB1DFB|nr:glycosyltransferase family 4 protein [uncultured Bacteroides sp.]
MKIVYLYTGLLTLGGADRVITEKANYFADKLGYDVYIITDSQNNKPPIFPLSPKVKHIDLNILFGQQYEHSIIIRGVFYFKLMRIYRKKLTKILNEIQPDFTISVLGRDSDFITKLPDKSFKIGEAHISKRFMRNYHLMEKKNLLHRIICKIWKRKLYKCIKELSAFVVLTKEDADNWKEIRKSIVIPNSLPFYSNLSSPCTNKEIISVGRLDEQKGYDLLINVWKIVVKKHPDWSIHIYGNGELKDILKEQIRINKIEKSFILEGTVPNIEDKYMESSFYVMSSRFEGFGMVLIEAMSCGLPCVSFDCPNGPKDIINDGIDGLLVENGNIDQLAEKICYMIEHPEEIKRMGAAAKVNIKRYNPDITMQKWVQLFKSLKNPQI